jgi:hypothetical protein
MNLAPCLRRAEKMSRLLDTLPPEEREIFRFLENHGILIRELNAIIPVFNRVSRFMKEKGLSGKSVDRSIRQLMPSVDSPYPRLSRAVKECMACLREEAGKLSDEESVCISHPSIHTPGRCRRAGLYRAFRIAPPDSPAIFPGNKKNTTFTAMKIEIICCAGYLRALTGANRSCPNLLNR